MKRSVKTLIMLLCLVLLLGSYFLVQHMNKSTETTAQKGDFPITEKTAQDVARLQWTKNEIDFDFTCTNGVWQKTDDAAYPCAQDILQAMAKNLTSLSAKQKLENTGDLAAYGLTEPAFSVTVTWQDGTQATYYMGNATPFEDGYYTLFDGEEKAVYVVEKSLSSLFYQSLVNMATLPSLPDLSQADRLVVEGKLDVSRKETSSTLVSTELWYDTESGEPLNSTTLNNHLSTLSTLSWEGVHISAPTEDELAALKLDGTGTDICVYAGDEVLMTLHVGLANPADGVHYVCLDDSSMIYTLKTSNISALLSASIATMPRTAVADATIGTLSTMTYTIGDKNWQFDITVTPAIPDDETTEEDESSDAVVAATLNGEATPPANVQKIWSLVSALIPQGRAENGSTEEVLLSLSAVDTEGRELTLTFYPMDADHYWAEISDGTPLRFTAADVDTLIRSVKSYQ